ncbi:unnamed protein product [Phyllotreta striolata]|uniref:GPI ethanolamine phosphate transferase 2 C-terminal domain-containing protein n=1 Tax=Phyllotreta striolata TaxID=444603 RepID=A0A9N9TQI7_PHYSR|nr:unnamed protein product [Phyllotreta striolata]
MIYFIITLATLVFFQGFFPVSRPSLDFNNDPPDEVNGVRLNKNEFYSSNVSKTIFMVIDALRLDFFNEDYMPLTYRLVQNNGCFNKIKVETPTVTLPRIKALTAGNIPQFVDLVLNLFSTEILSDSIIHSAVKAKKKVIFYGDETWIKLFPNKFSRFEGTHSFFVKDFTVDKNVTRNVEVELQKEDWDLMFLHYLDLDHIGHVYGPFSSLIPEKLHELDKMIYEYYKIFRRNENSLFLITGDHGMRDIGGHGGSTFHETNVPLLLIGLNCQSNTFRQTDIPVNIAALLGLTIPSISIGRVQKSLVYSTVEKYLYKLYYNTRLLVTRQFCSKYEEANSYYIDYIKNSNQSSAHKAIEFYEHCLETISDTLAKSSVKQNFHYLIVSLVILLNCLVSLLLDILGSNENKSVFFQYVIIFTIVIQYLIENNLYISSLLFVVYILLLLRNTRTLCSMISSNFSYYTLFFLVFCFLHPLTFISSSYVEEEHQFWYFFNTLIFLTQLTIFSKSKNYLGTFYCFMILVIFRFIRTMNATGDKWLNHPDLSDWFLKTENFHYYQIFHALSVIAVFLTQFYLINLKRLMLLPLNLLILTLIFVYKNNESSMLGKLIWLLIFINFLLTYKISKIVTWNLVLSLLLKPYNLILIPYCICSSLIISRCYKRTNLVVLHHIFLSNLLFFAQGHNNSLASVDISIGYIGLTSYQPILVISQVLYHTQAFPVLCHLLIFHQRGSESIKIWKLLFCSRLYIFIITSVITVAFRHHLFIWSVFAPKLFIEFTHLLFLFAEYIIYKINEFIVTKFPIYRINHK